MRQNITIGKQNFEKIRTENCFYIEKRTLLKNGGNGMMMLPLLLVPAALEKR